MNINQGDVPSPIDLKNKPSVNVRSLDKKGRHCVTPFLSKFEVFNRNLHNFLVDSRASSNVMHFQYARNRMQPHSKVTNTLYK
jgi:hypothetical protein